MGIKQFATEEEMDEEFERIEELNFELLSLREAVTEAENDLEYAKKELANFEEDNKEYLLPY